MKKLTIAFAAAGLLALGACNNTPENTTAENISDSLENQADALEDAADNATNEVVEENLENQADATENMASNVADAAH